MQILPEFLKLSCMDHLKQRTKAYYSFSKESIMHSGTRKKIITNKCFVNPCTKRCKLEGSYGHMILEINTHVLSTLEMHACVVSHFSCVQLFLTPWTVAHQAPLSMRFSRQEYWSGSLFPLLGDVSQPGIESTSLMSSALAHGTLQARILEWVAIPSSRESS